MSILEAQADGQSRLVVRASHDGNPERFTRTLEFQSPDCSGQPWVAGRISPSFAHPLPLTGEVLAAPLDAGYGFVPSVSFLSYSYDIGSPGDGGFRVCNRHETCSPDPDGGGRICTPAPAVLSATRLDPVGYDSPPVPPLVLVP